MTLSDEALGFLERCIWPSVLTHSERDVVFSEVREQIYQQGRFVCQRNEIPTGWIGVIDGFLRVQATASDGDLVMFTGVTSGGWVGEGSLLKIEPRRYEIVATRDTKTLHLPRATFLRLLDTSIPFNRFILNHLNERLSQFIGTMMFDRLLEPTARVARCIASLFNPTLYPNMVPALRISQEELAWMVGLSRPRVNQALKSLQEHNLIKLGYSSITVVDLGGLTQFE